MINFKQRDAVVTWLQCKRNVILVSFFWLLGLIVGLCYVRAESKLISSLVYYLPYNRLTFPGCLMVSVMPFLITITALRLSAPAVIYIYSAFKAFSYSCVICGITIAYGNADWLIRLLMLFSDSLIMLMLLWLWINHPYRKNIYKHYRICFVVAIALITIDYLFISPYLVSLMNYS